jgi:two-component system nitrate/nitrite response regulator NarL
VLDALGFPIGGGVEGSRDDIRILIADDHAIFREGLRKLLESEPSFRVVGEAADGEMALQLAREVKADVLLLDLAMPRMDGLETLREVAVHKPSLRTVVLTASIDRENIVKALQLGASGVVLKESNSKVLFDSIRAVASGHYWIGHESISDVIQTLRDMVSKASSKAKLRDFGLTPRERQIVAAVVGGFTNRDMARRFSISEQTVKHHLTNIFDKLGVSNRLELALFALNHDLVQEL